MTDPLPHFKMSKRPGRRINNLLTTFNGSLGLISFSLYMKSVMLGTTTWTLSTKIVLCTLILLWAVINVSIWYPARGQVTEAIVALEQQILIENLCASEIKKRFLQYIAGPELKDWLDQNSNIFADGYKNLKDFLIRATTDVNEACALPDTPEKLNCLELVKQSLQAEKSKLVKGFNKISLQEGAAVTVTWVLGRISGREVLNLVIREKKQLEEFESQLKALFAQLDLELRQTTDRAMKVEQISQNTDGTLGATVR